MFRRQRRVEQQSAHPDDAVERGANFVAGHRQEARLGPVGGVRMVARLAQRALGLGAIGDVAADALQLRRLFRIGPQQAFAPGDPFRPERRCDLLVVDPRAARLQRAFALLQNLEGEAAADQRLSRPCRELAIGVIDKDDAAFRVADHDQVALLLEQAAGALLGFLQFPIAVGKPLTVHGDLAELPAQQSQLDAQGRERDAGDCKQEARTDGERAGVVAGALRPAAGDKSVSAAEDGGEDHERPDDGGERRMAPRETAHVQLDPESRSHARSPLTLAIR